MRSLLVLVLLAAPALADNKSDAVALFQEGLKELKAGNFEKACASLKKSNELHADSGTRGSLARCYEKQGKVASAWTLWVDLSTTAPKNLRADAAANATKLEPRLPKYMLKLGPGVPQVSITIDGAATGDKPGIAVPIDPGTYVLEANADGYAGWKREFTAVEGKTEEITIPAMEPLLVKEPTRPKPIVVDEKPTPKSSRKKIGFAMVGVGGALVITGGVFGVIARGRNNDAKDICGGNIDACDPARIGDAQDKIDSARSAGNISTVAMIAGGAAVVTGIVFIVTAPSVKRGVAIAPSIGTDSAGVVFSGAF
ncbi:MAG: hypothetical protein M4D80_08275 [Myxococcota bacterium]|nr:hypothetical protein [Myxococcota bacterium]